MNRSQEKASRLLQIERLLWTHPEGLTRAEIARRLNVHRSTITKYLNKDHLPPSVYEDDLDGNKLKVDRTASLTRTAFNLHEVMAIHLATRLLATRTDKQNPHAASALRKLGSALARLDHNVSQHLLRSADVMDEAAAFRDPVYLQVLERLTEAWSSGRKVRISHQMPDGRVFEYLLAPYFIEPYAVGQTAHVIGWREPPGAIRTLKVERIRAAEMTQEPYTIPDDFDPRDLLRHAWGIWYTDAEPVAVVLRFHPRVMQRVRETRWHPSQQVEEQEDGYLLWRAQVAEPQEMLPWIRGWGADCEVLTPDNVRERLYDEVYRLASLYQVSSVPAISLYQRLWAKADRGRSVTHPLICHLLDVAQVAQTLWEEVLTDGFRRHIANVLELDVEAAGRAIAFWAGLHDLGKASPCFQRKYPPAKAELAAAGLTFARLFTRESCPHGSISSLVLPSLLEGETGLPPRLAKRVAQALGGHHGSWPIPGELQHLRTKQTGGGEWEEVRSDLFRALIQVVQPPTVARLGRTRQEENTLLALLSGLTSVADWIGSTESYFPYADAPVDLQNYARKAMIQAREALASLHWTDWQPPAKDASFEDIFPFAPNPTQQAVISLMEHLDRPALIVIESPTGSGKTEAALYAADRAACRLQQRGLYVAMPTMATSNQMHTRVSAMLQQRYGEPSVPPLLVHSQARWMRELPPPQMTIHGETAQERTEAMAWFLPRKRSLLAPFGVGTVDQALLSVLQTRHFFVRLFGLSHKTVVFDEVHAYDTYMSTLFQRLLGWLRSVGASVVLLSATLPDRTRRELIRAYAGSAVELQPVSYPAITWTTGGEDGKCGTIPLQLTDNREIRLEWIERTPEAVAGSLKEALREGGCAAVICNTVGRAQSVYRALKSAQIVPEASLILFHARYPFVWRDEIEREVLNRFGKEGPRPNKAIVVATQVIEQSLDLDFDVMVSDLAPVDLLLQRAGRLHRHSRKGRPAPVSSPQLIITVSEGEDGLPRFESDRYIYEPYVLLRSYLTLQGRERLSLPSETTALIEAVYGEETEAQREAATPATIEALAAARQRMQAHEDTDVFEARKRLVLEPEDEGLLNQRNPALAEESPELHAAFQALTRLSPPTVSLVCLHATEAGWNTEPDGSGQTINLDREPDSTQTYHLARCTVSVSHRGVVKHLLAQEEPKAWREHPLLRHHRVACFNGGLCQLEGTDYHLQLSREFGLEIERKA